jgi:hypothetical protein
MIPQAISPPLRNTPWVRLPTPQTRQFVNHEVLRLIRRTVVGEASLKAFRFQAPSDCVSNSRLVREALVNSLIETGHLIGPTPDKEKWGQTVSRWLGLARPTVERTVISGEQLIRINRQHGPLVLTLHGALPPGQGDDRYTKHHAVVLIASFEMDGTQVGILLDGNDLQRNPAIDRIAQWLAAQEQVADLSQLTLEDLERINSAPTTADLTQGEDGAPPTNVLQAAFRLVDLGALVARAEQQLRQTGQFAMADGAHSERPNLLECDGSLSTQGDPIPSDVLDELRQAIRQAPQLIERFEPEL